MLKRATARIGRLFDESVVSDRSWKSTKTSATDEAPLRDRVHQNAAETVRMRNADLVDSETQYGEMAISSTPFNSHNTTLPAVTENSAITESAMRVTPGEGEGEGPTSDEAAEHDVRTLPAPKNALYNASEIVTMLKLYPQLKIRRDGRYYLKMEDSINEAPPQVRRNEKGDIEPVHKIERLGPVENVVRRFCEDVLCISRADFLPLSSQGERHLVWVGKKKANHIIRFLNGAGTYVVNRFPGDIFLKDKQVLGVTLTDHMLLRGNVCKTCKREVEQQSAYVKANTQARAETIRICREMVHSMLLDETGCQNNKCPNYGKKCCKHFDVFVPELQSFCTYNALQDFANRLNDDLRGQTFVCKPAYLFKGYGFRFFRNSEEFQIFYHMTEGKATSRHDFMVQRLVDHPHLHNERKFDICAFLLVIVLHYRRVISFIHYGFCQMASIPFETVMESDFKEEQEDTTAKTSTPSASVTLDRSQSSLEQEARLEKDMQMLVCTYRTNEEIQNRKKLFKAKKLVADDEDRCIQLETVFSEEHQLEIIKKQILNIAVKLTQAIEEKVWDWIGCFQIFGLNLCVDHTLKVWLLEVNSKAISEVDTLSPTQRLVLPAVYMEAIGLVMETTYKSLHRMRLRKNPADEFQDTGFIFRKNFDFAFSTLRKKRSDYKWPEPPKEKQLPYYLRIAQVDRQFKSVDKQRRFTEQERTKEKTRLLELKLRRDQKDTEES